MNKSIFITGTDTGIGKTAVTAALLSILKSAGIDAVPMKPVQSGCKETDSGRSAPDLEYALSSADITPSGEEKELMCPIRLKAPCSPHLAADMENTIVSISDILDSYKKLSEQHEMVLLEGAGGLLVPVYDDITMLDLIKMMELPVILVARPGLGTINHTLLSLREVERAGLKTLGVIFCESEPSESPEIDADNRKTIEHISGVRILGNLPYSKQLATEKPGPIDVNSDFMKNMPDADLLLEQI